MISAIVLFSLVFLQLALCHSVGNRHVLSCYYKTRCGRKATYAATDKCASVFKQYRLTFMNMTVEGYQYDWSDTELLFLRANWTAPGSQPPRLWSIAVGFNAIEATCVAIETAQWTTDNITWLCPKGENLRVVAEFEDRMDQYFQKPESRETLFECD
jgi:hypothetical protein